MKSKSAIFAAVIAAAAFASLAGCKKSDLEIMSGSYTYKTSGIVGLVPTALIGKGQPLDTVWVGLTPEQGQLNIVTKDSETSTMILSWNDLTGNACSTQAHLDGRTLTLAPNTKTVLLTDGTQVIGEGIVMYSGAGTLYDNMLLIPMEYRGTFQCSSVQMTAVASKVECIAKAN